MEESLTPLLKCLLGFYQRCFVVSVISERRPVGFRTVV